MGKHSSDGMRLLQGWIRVPDPGADTDPPLSVPPALYLAERFRLFSLARGFGVGDHLCSFTVFPDEEVEIEIKTWNRKQVDTDRDGRYASDDHWAALDRHGIVASMSRRGDCWDNAVAESVSRERRSTQACPPYRGTSTCHSTAGLLAIITTSTPASRAASGATRVRSAAVTGDRGKPASQLPNRDPSVERHARPGGGTTMMDMGHRA